MKYKCNRCRKIISERELLLIGEDPSPEGISLPAGEHITSCCPHCGSDDLEKFNLTEALDISEGDDDLSTFIEFNGTRYLCYIDDSGAFRCTAVV